MSLFSKGKKQNKPYTFEEMSFYDDIVYDEEGLNIGYDNNPAMESVNMPKQGNTKTTGMEAAPRVVENSMTGVEYEQSCASYLRNNGYTNVSVTKASGDQGVDIIATKDGIKYGIQCKYYKSPVGNKAVQEAMAGAMYYKCDQAVVMTNSTFTPAAIELANSIGVLLWPNMELGKSIGIRRAPLFNPEASLLQKIVSVTLTLTGITVLILGALAFIVAAFTDGIARHNVDIIFFLIGGFFNLINGRSKSCDYIAIGMYSIALILAVVGGEQILSSWPYYIPLLLTTLHLIVYIFDERKAE